MLHGRFGNTSKRPFLEGLLILPRRNIRTDVSFLVDTGSDVTLLNPQDGRRMGLDYSKLSGSEESGGIGGVQNNFLEPAVVVFTEPGRRLVTYVIELRISPPGVDETLNSLLGRDIIDRMRMIYNPSAGQLTFTVKDADLFTPL